MRGVLIAVMLLTTLPAFAQSKLMIGGVDTRVPPIEGDFLAQQVGQLTHKLANAAALLMVEQADRKEAEDRATATKAWLDQSWNEMEYWRAYAGNK